MTLSGTGARRHVLHIFGGGELVGVAAKAAAECGWSAVVRTGSRFKDSLPGLGNETPVFVGNDLRALMREGGLPQPGDIGISFSAPWVFEQDIIDLFSGAIFNLHSQALPRFRGGGGTSWLALMRERRGGCCVHRLVRKIDAGEIYARADYEFPGECVYPADLDRHALDHARCLVKAWLPGLLCSGDPGPALPVDEAVSEYWPRLNTSVHGWIDWSWSLRDIESFCHAFSFPHPGAKTTIRGTTAMLKRVEIVAERTFHPFQRGLVFRIDRDGGIMVAHSDGALVIREFEVEDSSLVVRLGDRFFTPIAHLENALARRVQYLPSGELVGN